MAEAVAQVRVLCQHGRQSAKGLWAEQGCSVGQQLRPSNSAVAASRMLLCAACACCTHDQAHAHTRAHRGTGTANHSLLHLLCFRCSAFQGCVAGWEDEDHPAAQQQQPGDDTARAGSSGAAAAAAQAGEGGAPAPTRPVASRSTASVARFRAFEPVRHTAMSIQQLKKLLLIESPPAAASPAAALDGEAPPSAMECDEPAPAATAGPAAQPAADAAAEPATTSDRALALPDPASLSDKQLTSLLHGVWGHKVGAAARASLSCACMWQSPHPSWLLHTPKGTSTAHS